MHIKQQEGLRRVYITTTRQRQKTVFGRSEIQMCSRENWGINHSRMASPCLALMYRARRLSLSLSLGILAHCEEMENPILTRGREKEEIERGESDKNVTLLSISPPADRMPPLRPPPDFFTKQEPTDAT